MNPRILLAVVVGVIGIAPMVAPAFYVTLLNYIGLYSLVALGLVLLTGVAGQTSFSIMGGRPCGRVRCAGRP